MEPHYLLSPRLQHLFIKYDHRVWEAWNTASSNNCNLRNDNYHEALNFEMAIKRAASAGNLDFLVWLYNHNSPWRSFEWRACDVLTEHPNIGHAQYIR